MCAVFLALACRLAHTNTKMTMTMTTVVVVVVTLTAYMSQTLCYTY